MRNSTYGYSGGIDFAHLDSSLPPEQLLIIGCHKVLIELVYLILLFCCIHSLHGSDLKLVNGILHKHGPAVSTGKNCTTLEITFKSLANCDIQEAQTKEMVSLLN